MWRLPTLVAVTTLRGHKRGVWCVEFSPVDQAVITASGVQAARSRGRAGRGGKPQERGARQGGKSSVQRGRKDRGPSLVCM